MGFSVCVCVCVCVCAYRELLYTQMKDTQIGVHGVAICRCPKPVFKAFSAAYSVIDSYYCVGLYFNRLGFKER